jgi:DNA-cytosine methyltransferase
MSVGKKEKINVLSLFDGMSCGQIALNKLGIEIENYYASEIDKYAIQVTQNNYPNTIQLGSVTEVKGSDLPKIDLLYGGSPCQGFSLAGKQLNFEDERSKLFFEFVRLLEECKPKYFLLENVNMQQDWQDIITSYLGVKPILINSSVFTAQFRDRLYWTNIPFDEPIQKTTILLKDILEGDIEYTHKCSDIQLQKSPNGIENIKKGTSGFSWFYEQQTYTKNSLTRTLKAGGGSGNIPKVLNDDLNMFRKLTPIECERLQSVPYNYTNCVSNNQRYRMLGNGWTVDVIAYIFSFLKVGEIFNNFSNENVQVTSQVIQNTIPYSFD